VEEAAMLIGMVNAPSLYNPSETLKMPLKEEIL
jgi:membrane peptidoglycan carboxypeptidase